MPVPDRVGTAQSRSAAASWLPPAVVLGCFVVLLVAERRRPLRRSVEPRRRHDLRNLALAATTALAVRVADRPVTSRAAALVQRRRIGLLQVWRLPAAVETVLAVMLMDYTLYWWHVLLHRVPFLWRCHLAHHVDLDLTASTALRFHFLEMVLSVPWRAAQILLIGVRPRDLQTWQAATLAEVIFQHSNLRLPRRLERLLEWLVVTPRMHGIHHSTVRAETDSNWSSGLTVWDRLHGTLRCDVPQRAIVIGTPGYRDPDRLRLPAILALPFKQQPSAWLPPPAAATPRVDRTQSEPETTENLAKIRDDTSLR